MLHQFREGSFITSPAPGEMSRLQAMCFTCGTPGSLTVVSTSSLGSSAAVQEEAVCLEVALFCDPQGEVSFVHSIFYDKLLTPKGFPAAQLILNPPSNAGDTRDAGSIPESRRSPGDGNGKLLQ